jgi:glycosyltransferase involved in cell wall biosynthesis
MGGTDVHIDLAHSECDEDTYQLLNQARAISFFSVEAMRIVEKLHSAWKDKLWVIPQGVMLPPIHDEHHPYEEKKQFFHILLPAGLRGVKDVLHLLNAWIDLDSRISNLKVTIVGEVLDEQVYAEVLQACDTYSFLEYVKPVPFEEMGKMYATADVVVNTSIEEGQPTAVCEAMALGIPAIVRHNPGNVSVVTHQRTGWVYEEPMQFVQIIENLRQDPTKRKQIIADAKTFILTERSVEKEVISYLRLLHQMGTENKQ